MTGRAPTLQGIAYTSGNEDPSAPLVEPNPEERLIQNPNPEEALEGFELAKQKHERIRGLVQETFNPTEVPQNPNLMSRYPEMYTAVDEPDTIKIQLRNLEDEGPPQDKLELEDQEGNPIDVKIIGRVWLLQKDSDTPGLGKAKVYHLGEDGNWYEDNATRYTNDAGKNTNIWHVEKNIRVLSSAEQDELYERLGNIGTEKTETPESEQRDPPPEKKLDTPPEKPEPPTQEKEEQEPTNSETELNDHQRALAEKAARSRREAWRDSRNLNPETEAREERRKENAQNLREAKEAEVTTEQIETIAVEQEIEVAARAYAQIFELNTRLDESARLLGVDRETLTAPNPSAEDKLNEIENPPQELSPEQQKKANEAAQRTREGWREYTRDFSEVSPEEKKQQDEEAKQQRDLNARALRAALEANVTRETIRRLAIEQEKAEALHISTTVKELRNSIQESLSLIGQQNEGNIERLGQQYIDNGIPDEPSPPSNPGGSPEKPPEDPGPPEEEPDPIYEQLGIPPQDKFEKKENGGPNPNLEARYPERYRFSDENRTVEIQISDPNNEQKPDTLTIPTGEEGQFETVTIVARIWVVEKNSDGTETAIVYKKDSNNTWHKQESVGPSRQEKGTRFWKMSQAQRGTVNAEQATQLQTRLSAMVPPEPPPNPDKPGPKDPPEPLDPELKTPEEVTLTEEQEKLAQSAAEALNRYWQFKERYPYADSEKLKKYTDDLDVKREQASKEQVNYEEIKKRAQDIARARAIQAHLSLLDFEDIQELTDEEAKRKENLNTIIETAERYAQTTRKEIAIQAYNQHKENKNQAA